MFISKTTGQRFKDFSTTFKCCNYVSPNTSLCNLLIFYINTQNKLLLILLDYELQANVSVMIFSIIYTDLKITINPFVSPQ